MAMFVIFDDGYGTYNFRAIFPSRTPKSVIYNSLSNKIKKYLKDRGRDEEEFNRFEYLKEWTSITNMREGKFYEPEHWDWND